MDKNVRKRVILAVVVVAAVLFFVLQSDEKTIPAPHEEAHVVHWSYEPGTEATVELPVKFGDRIFTTGDNTGVYHYEGSLTTPPCTEGAQWFIRRTPTQLSKAQIAAFTAVYDSNNRPVQALNDRVCYLDETPDVTIK